MNLTNRPDNHKLIFFWNFLGFRKKQNSISGSKKTNICIDKLPFTLHLLVGLIHNSTTAKELKLAQLMPSKKKSKLVFLLPG